MNRIFTLFALLIGVPFFISGCGNHDDDTISVAVSSHLPPFTFIEYGQLRGFEIDLITVAARKMGKSVAVKDVGTFDNMFSFVKSGKADVAVGAITIEDAQANSTFHSISYMSGQLGVVLKKGVSLDNINSFIGRNISTQEGVIYEKWAKENFRDSIITKRGNLRISAEELEEEKIQMIVTNLHTACRISRRSYWLYCESIPNTTHEYVIITKNDDKFIKELNATLHKMQEDGEMETIIKRWRMDAEHQCVNSNVN
ncbi:putative aminoacid ABC-transporter periplasmic substrate-binding protein [Candidatus Fokinia solitaria]|uniref:Putative aminoacid ABC-transporter periplasmic substrate-binding protein n=1 Tax=Candidatus Fokinia solitaria TaxID=1802984 RepID=A0A2U8BSD5_9RICK|nr:ABC transporter substrate-binding protein [Candidatus Fokinia solitaria]AWD33247.1 putative aminoacid ABC-transporter periplasmic substrate-binding protein [Candidatus Fokinia solitaria]